MAKRALQTGDARTTDRTSARDPGTAVGTCGKRRRWTAEQKHKIVVEGMEPDMSAAMVAGRHGISTGQFYAGALARRAVMRQAPGMAAEVWRVFGDDKIRTFRRDHPRSAYRRQRAPRWP